MSYSQPGGLPLSAAEEALGLVSRSAHQEGQDPQL